MGGKVVDDGALTAGPSCALLVVRRPLSAHGDETMRYAVMVLLFAAGCRSGLLPDPSDPAMHEETAPVDPAPAVAVPAAQTPAIAALRPDASAADLARQCGYVVSPDGTQDQAQCCPAGMLCSEDRDCCSNAGMCVDGECAGN